MLKEHYDELAHHDERYWWFRSRHQLAADLLRSCPGAADGPIIDWGCGAGGFLNYLRNDLGIPRERLLGFDSSPYAAQALSERNLPHRLLDEAGAAADQISSPFSALFMLDVLEHVEHPVELLRDLRQKAVSGAALIILVPAFSHLWSVWDEQLHHFRRYDRRLIIDQVEQAGWTFRSARYFFSGLYPLALIRKLASRKSSVARTEFPKTPPWLNETLVAWFAFERRLGLPIPFGTSLAAVAVNLPTPRPSSSSGKDQV